MFQIDDFAEFSRLLKVARGVMPPPGQYALNKTFDYVYYLDAAKVVGDSFFPILQHLATLNNTRVFYFLMLDPDPIDYYFYHFKSYPAYTLSIKDSMRDYAQVLHADPGNSPADAIGYSGHLFAIFSDDLSWFIAANRDIGVATVGSSAEVSENIVEREFMSEPEVKQWLEQLSQ